MQRRPGPNLSKRLTYRRLFVFSVITDKNLSN
jgi:hypothetical protein